MNHKTIDTMKASEYIARLQELIAEHGDLDMVFRNGDLYHTYENPCPTYIDYDGEPYFHVVG